MGGGSVARTVASKVRAAYDLDADFAKLVEAAKTGALPADVTREVLALSERKGRRRIHLVDKAGHIVRDVTDVEVALGALRRKEVEFGVVEGVTQQTVCAGVNGKRCPEAAKPGKHAFRPDVIRARQGRPWVCVACACRRTVDAFTPEQRNARRERGKKQIALLHASMTPEQRIEIGRKQIASLTPEQRSERSRKGFASRTPEQRAEHAARSRKNLRGANESMTASERSERSRKANAALNEEQRSERSRKANASIAPERRTEISRKQSESMSKANALMTPEERSARARKGKASMGPEQIAAAVRKTWETRRAKASARMEVSR